MRRWTWTLHDLTGLALGAVLLGLAAAAGAEEPTRQRFDAAALAGWEVWGAGDAKLEGGALVLREGEDSKGVNLVSPQTFPRELRARLRLQPMRQEGVVVVILSAGPVGAAGGGELEPPAGYRGEQSFWKEAGIASYAFAFHTGYHQPNAFVALNPGWTRLVEVPDVATGERAYDVEVGRDAERLWLAVDGAPVFETPLPDPPGLAGGRLAVRLRGPGDGSFATRIESIEIVTRGSDDD